MGPEKDAEGETGLSKGFIRRLLRCALASVDRRLGERVPSEHIVTAAHQRAPKFASTEGGSSCALVAAGRRSVGIHVEGDCDSMVIVVKKVALSSRISFFPPPVDSEVSTT